MAKTLKIRPISICVFQHQGRILVVEKVDSHRGDRFARPAGGGIDFGETSAEAIVREIDEEFGAEVEQVKLLGVLESIFTCDREAGHEIVFVYDASFCDRSLYEQPQIQGREGADEFVAVWRSLQELREAGTRLVPEALIELLAP